MGRVSSFCVQGHIVSRSGECGGRRGLNGRMGRGKRGWKDGCEGTVMSKLHAMQRPTTFK